MFKKVIKYLDHDGTEKETTCYFNLTKFEAVELQFSKKGTTLEDHIKTICETNDNKEILGALKEIILSAYGIKTEDGTFRKSKQISDDFSHTEAFSELLMSFFTDQDAAAEFVNKLIPNVSDPIPKLKTKPNDHD